MLLGKIFSQKTRNPTDTIAQVREQAISIAKNTAIKKIDVLYTLGEKDEFEQIKPLINAHLEHIKGFLNETDENASMALGKFKQEMENGIIAQISALKNDNKIDDKKAQAIYDACSMFYGAVETSPRGSLTLARPAAKPAFTPFEQTDYKKLTTPKTPEAERGAGAMFDGEEDETQADAAHSPDAKFAALIEEFDGGYHEIAQREIDERGTIAHNSILDGHQAGLRQILADESKKMLSEYKTASTKVEAESYSILFQQTGDNGTPNHLAAWEAYERGHALERQGKREVEDAEARNSQLEQKHSLDDQQKNYTRVITLIGNDTNPKSQMAMYNAFMDQIKNNTVELNNKNLNDFLILSHTLLATKKMDKAVSQDIAHITRNAHNWAWNNPDKPFAHQLKSICRLLKDLLPPSPEEAKKQPGFFQRHFQSRRIH